jgi:hypothetical protein
MKSMVGRWVVRPGTLLAIICLLAGVFMLWAAWTDSAINDEVAHIPAGYDYVRYFTYNLNPEHPPLIKALASISTIFLRPQFPVDQFSPAHPIANNEWAVGSQFLYGEGNNADAIIRFARLFPIAITILTIILIYFLSRMLMGPWWSLIPSFLFAFDPTILAHGHYVTTDVGAAFGVMSATYYFLQHLETRSQKSVWFAGVAFGIAELAKFSTVILIPFFLFLYFLIRKKHRHLFADVLSIFAIGYVLVYAVYAIFMIHYPSAQQVVDTVAALNARLGGVYGLGSLVVWMAGHTLFRPIAEYLLGFLMVASHVAGGTFLYAFGKVSIGGGWWYFPAIFLLKEPVPILALIVIAFAMGIGALFAKKQESNKNVLVFAVLSFVAAYWYVSMSSSLDHGIRYLIPTFPFIYILAVYGWSRWFRSAADSSRARRVLTIGYSVLGCLLVWLFLETFFNAPYFLSYYNEFAGGTWNGYQYATDSNYDWGQDLLRFQSFMNQHPEISSVAVGYLGRGDVHYYLGNRAADWASAQGNPAKSGIHWFAISIDTLELATQPAGVGVSRGLDDTYAWLTALRPPTPGMGNVPVPDYRIGTSIFIYHL